MPESAQPGYMCTQLNTIGFEDHAHASATQLFYDAVPRDSLTDHVATIPVWYAVYLKKAFNRWRPPDFLERIKFAARSLTLALGIGANAANDRDEDNWSTSAKASAARASITLRYRLDLNRAVW